MTMKLFITFMFLSNTLLFSQESIEVLGVLSSEISETSGLLFHNGKLITHNDSGNTPQLFEIDTVSYQITRTVTISNVENIDWEDLAQDDEYIYIGDFGNNLGTRTDLSIYRISKQEYNQSDTVTAESINFAYEDQTDFTDSGVSDWDAEALFVLNDKLIILTKQWQSNGTIAYELSKNIGDQVALRLDSYQIDGLVTAASYNPESKVIFIMGYSSLLVPFTVRIANSTSTTIFTETITRTNLNIGMAQAESITYVDDNTYFFTSEHFERMNPSITLEAQLFKFDVTEQEPDPDPGPGPEPDPEPEPQTNEIQIFQRPGYELIEYDLNTEDQLLGRAIYDAAGRQHFYLLGSEVNENSVDLSTLQNSVYYLTFYFDNRIESIPFIKH